MAYPTSLDDLSTTRGTTGQPLSSPNHITQHTLEDTAIQALEAKVGINGSAVTTTHDYKLSGVLSSDKASSLAGTENLSSKTLVSPKISLGSDATGDIYYNGGSGALTRLAISTDGKILKLASGVPSWATETVTNDASTTVKGIAEEATQAEIDAGTATGGTGARLFVNPSTLATSLYNFAPSVTVSTDFETAARFTSDVSGGTNTFGIYGVTIDTTVTTTRYASLQWLTTFNSVGGPWVGSPVMGISLETINIGTAGSSFFGLGTVTVAGTGHTYTTKHAGFKILYTAGPTATLYATQGDGSTENASSSLTTFAVGDHINLVIRINSTTSIDYFWSKNGGAWSAATNLTSNMPSSTNQLPMQFSVSNNSTATQNAVKAFGATYKR